MGGVVALQVYGGVLVSWTHVIPIWGQGDWARFSTPVMAFALALLAGMAIDGIAQGLVDRRRALLCVIGVAAAAVALVAVAAWPLAITSRVAVLGGWPLALATLAVILTTVTFVRGTARATVLAVVVIAEIALLAPHGFYADRDDPYPARDWIGYLQANTDADHSRIFSTDAALFPNIAGVYGLQDPRMLDALYVDRYWRYVRAFVSKGITDRFTATGVVESAPAVAGNPMFNLLGVRYLVYDERSPGPPSWSNPQYQLVTAVRV